MKKAYLEPLVEVLIITGQQMLAFSGGAVGDDPIVDPTPDVDDGTNNSRLFSDDDAMLFFIDE